MIQQEPHFVREKITSGPSPETQLWCGIVLTFFEDMNYYIELKTKTLLSNERLFDLKNRGLDTTAIVTKEQYLTLLDMRMRRLIYSAKNEYTKQVLLLAGMDHRTFWRRLVWQYKNTAKIRLTPLSQEYLEELN